MQELGKSPRSGASKGRPASGACISLASGVSDEIEGCGEADVFVIDHQTKSGFSGKTHFLSAAWSMKKAKAGLLIIIFSALMQSVPFAQAREAYLSDIVVTNTRDHVLVYFTVNGCFNAEMNNAIESGLKTSFTFFVTLYEKRSLWWDKELVALEVSHTIKYDNLKKVYEVSLSEENNKVLTVKNYEQAKKLMAEVAALKVTRLHHLKKGGRYRLRLMAELDKIKLPLYLHYVLFFLSLWDFQTDWYEVDFRY